MQDAWEGEHLKAYEMYQTKGTEYVEMGLHYYEEKYKDRLLKGLQKRAHELGMMIMPAPNKEEVAAVESRQELSHA